MFNKFVALPLSIKQYLLITNNYWFFTLTDGALRMLVLLYFYQLGYAPLALAMLFVFYEAFGVVTNLVGGWLGARIGLNKTMNIGLSLQVFSLLMLAIPHEYLSLFWVMLAQALSGIAKDLNKMSAKSSIKVLVADVNDTDKNNKLFKWVALLTGSKNTLKGIGFFLGGFLLTVLGFQGAVLLMASVLAIVAMLSAILLKSALGKAKYKPKFSQIFSTHSSLNYLSAARLCLFAARDVWFVIALPVYLSSQLSWTHQNIGAFLALWIIAYGIVQAYAPVLFRKNKHLVDGKLTATWSMVLSFVTLFMLVIFLLFEQSSMVILIGLFIFGGVFAINSSLHSYLIIALAQNDRVSMDVGFYYMANALGRLLGTILSGAIYQYYGLALCLVFSIGLAFSAGLLVKRV